LFEVYEVLATFLLISIKRIIFGLNLTDIVKELNQLAKNIKPSMED
jgi:hypothetical protein